MSRIEINLPNRYLFNTQIPVRIGDINRAQHVGHVNLIQILDEASVQFFIYLGYKNIVNINQGLGFVMADLAIAFKKQAHYGQVLKVEIAAADLKEKNFDIVYRVTLKSTGEEIARAKTGTLIFDYRQQKIIPIPDELKNKLTG